MILKWQEVDLSGPGNERANCERAKSDYDMSTGGNENETAISFHYLLAHFHFLRLLIPCSDHFSTPPDTW